jgi:oligopeptidase B
MKRILLPLMMLGVVITLTGLNPAPPVASVLSDSLYMHGRYLADSYNWLKETDSPQVKKYLQAEGKYASALLKPSRELADDIYAEFLSRLNETETTLPYLDHGFYYYSRTEKGKAYSIHCRKLQISQPLNSAELKHPEAIQTVIPSDSLIALEQIILDENELAKGKAYFSLGSMSVSPDSKLLAYSLDVKGDELYSLYIKDLVTGKTLKTPFHNVSEALWMADSQTLLISTMNPRMQTDTVLRWKLNDPICDTLYEEEDPAWDVSLYHNCDRTMIFLSASSKDATEVYYLGASEGTGQFQCILPRSAKHIYLPDYYEGKFYIRSNQWQRDYDIAVCDSAFTSLDSWQILCPGTTGEPMENFLVMDSHLILLQRKNGFKTIVIADRRRGEVTDSIVPLLPTDLNFWVNLDPRAEEITYTLENDITPLTVNAYDLNTKSTRQLRQYLPAGDFDPNNYGMALNWVMADDGTRIPLILTFRNYEDVALPVTIKLGGYGAYGDCNEPYFSSTALSLMDRGIILATAHIRGGSEFGQDWYDAGRLLHKKNTFTDFIACMDYLVSEGFTTPEQLIIEGSSAGGLLMGAVTNMAPEKCALVIADVPFVDLMQTMLDESLPLTIQEYEEWGNPQVKEYFDYMLSYSPVDNVKPGNYPAMLISAAQNDTRVMFSEAVRWTAKLRANNLGSKPIVLNIHKDEGHTGQMDRYKALNIYAESVAWMLYLIYEQGGR